MENTSIPHFNRIISFEQLMRSWRVFKQRKESKRDVAAFSAQVVTQLWLLHRDVLSRQYCHGPYRHFVISDPKRRDIHKSSVRDRVVHHALYAALYPYFDKCFIYDSYSCRLNKGTHRALNRFADMSRKVSQSNARTCWVLKCDIRKFFASIDHAALKSIIAEHVVDDDTRWLLDQIIDSFHTEGKEGVGLPLGNLTSQLLVNVYMNEFDHFMKHTLGVSRYIRYADDFVILDADKNTLEMLLPKIRDFLKERLALDLHPDKVSIATVASGIDFLGWVHFPRHRVLRTVTKRRMLKNIAKSHKPETIASYQGMLKHGNGYKLKLHLEVILRGNQYPAQLLPADRHQGR